MKDPKKPFPRKPRELNDVTKGRKRPPDSYVLEPGEHKRSPLTLEARYEKAYGQKLPTLSHDKNAPTHSTMDLVMDVRCWVTRFKARLILEERFERPFSPDEVVSYILEDPRQGAKLLERVALLWTTLPDPGGRDLPPRNRYSKKKVL